MLPPPLIFRIQDVLAVIGTDIYVPSIRGYSDSGDQLTIGADTYPLERYPLGARVLECMYLEQTKGEFAKIQSQAIKSLELENLDDGALRRRVLEVKLLDFIVHKVYPSYMGTSSGGSSVDDPLLNIAQQTGKVSTGAGKQAKEKKRQPERNLVERRKPAPPDDPVLADLFGSEQPATHQDGGEEEADPEMAKPELLSTISNTDEPCVLERIIAKSGSVMLFEGGVYTLVREAAEKKSQMSIRVSGKRYSVRFMEESSMLQERYQEALVKSAEDQAVKSSPLLHKSVRKLEELRAELASPQFQSCGLHAVRSRREDSLRYRLTLDVPQFVNKGDDGIYLFPPTTIALTLGITESGSLDPDYLPFVEGKYRSPFISNWDASNQRICMGKYKPPELVSIEQCILAVLQTARTTIMRGYPGEHRGYHPMNGALYADCKISPEKMKRLDLRPANEV